MVKGIYTLTHTHIYININIRHIVFHGKRGKDRRKKESMSINNSLISPILVTLIQSWFAHYITLHVLNNKKVLFLYVNGPCGCGPLGNYKTDSTKTCFQFLNDMYTLQLSITIVHYCIFTRENLLFGSHPPPPPKERTFSHTFFCLLDNPHRRLPNTFSGQRPQMVGRARILGFNLGDRWSKMNYKGFFT